MRTYIAYFMQRINQHFIHYVSFRKELLLKKRQLKLVQNENIYPILNDETTSKRMSTDPKESIKSDKISLIISALEDSEEKAVNNALYKAICQTYCTFTSRNLTNITTSNKFLLNNIVYHYIKKYIKRIDNKKVFVVLQVNINIRSLFSLLDSPYSIPLGVTFALNVKEKELNVMNEQIILNDLLQQIKNMIPKSFDLKLEAKDLKEISYKKFGEFLTGSFISSDPRNPYNHGYNKFLRKYKIIIDDIDNSYLAEMIIHYIPSETTKTIVQMIIDVFQSISISQKDIHDHPDQKFASFSIGSIEKGNYRCYYFRSPYNLFRKWEKQLFELFIEEFSNFKIVDNMGIESDFKPEIIFDNNSLTNICNSIDKCEYNFSRGKGIFKIAIFQSSIMEWYHIKNLDLSYLINPQTDIDFHLRINFLINKNHIYKYSRFNIKHKHDN
ncbi:MAG: hypothetical protein GX416_08065 [Bacteroidales bacterium]|nr:hypothetical protein [Bacteroidales bacterium]